MAGLRDCLWRLSGFSQVSVENWQTSTAGVFIHICHSVQQQQSDGKYMPSKYTVCECCYWCFSEARPDSEFASLQTFEQRTYIGWQEYSSVSCPDAGGSAVGAAGTPFYFTSTYVKHCEAEKVFLLLMIPPVRIRPQQCLLLFYCDYLNQALNVSLTVILLVSMQLKKDKERLQAMMAHLKSSEPKPAAQPVSLLIKINVLLVATLRFSWLGCFLFIYYYFFNRSIWCLMCLSPRQHCPKALLLWACLRVPRHQPHPWRRSQNPPQFSLPIACSLEPLCGGGTAALWAKVTEQLAAFYYLIN